jgi:hypothetical protein
MKMLALAVLGSTMAISNDWKIAAGAFLGSCAAHMFNTASLRRLVRRAIQEHLKDCSAYQPPDQPD